MNKLYLILLILITPLHSLSQYHVRDYTYNASDNESKIDARNITLKEIKRLLIEELGVYINTTTTTLSKHNGNRIDIETQVKIISECITQTEILEEKWNGEEYYLKVKIYVDEKDLIRRLKKISKSDKDKKIPTYSQQLPPKKEKWIDIKNESLYGYLNVNYQMDGILSVGLSFGVNVDNKFILGVYGDINIYEEGIYGNNKGLFFESIIFGNRKINISIPIKLGSSLIYPDVYQLTDKSCTYIEPSININIPIGDNLKISTGVGYKISDNTEISNTPLINLSFKIIN